ncbi:MAG: restriction endonuclease subunit S [Bacteroidaceae bacterium]|nr:restriction endonuclease subunit S [Bacteroidaceae bacterium]
MERYSSYKDSGVSWIGDIPEHWEVKQLRSFLTLFSEKGHGDAQLLSVTREQGVIERDKEDQEENHNFVPDDLSGYKYIEKGDFAINKMKAWQGSYAVSEYNGIVSPAYFTCKLKGVNKDFFSKAIRSKVYVPFFTQYSKGIRVGQWDLNPNALKSIPFFLPTPDEQSVIVKYIDDKTSKIDAYVADKEIEIELLQELKQKTIADAVTKGLNPDAKMKDSGISWIGEIPKHWEVKKIGTLFVERKEKVSDKEYPALSVSKQGVTPQLENAVKTDNGDNRKKVCTNDFVVNSRSDRKGSCGVSPYTGSVSLINIVLSPRENIVVQYFHHLFRSNNYIEEYYRIGRGIVADLWTTRYSEMRNISVPRPPLDEQRAIVSYIEEKCQKIDSLTTELQSEIDYLKEYKQRLIADCVTGQVNVQNH